MDTTILPLTYLKLSNAMRELTLQIVNDTLHEERSSEFMNNNGMSRFAREICKELRKPYMPYSRNDVWARIQIPNVKYLDAVRAPLMLIAHERQNRYDHTRHPVLLQSLSAYSVFTFVDEGVELFDQWRSRCREDADFRKALKLPPK